jgi:cytoskeletal protein CcmA (bactofilin family)
MWKRDEAVRQPAVPNNDAAATTAHAAAPQAFRPDGFKGQNERDVVNIGKSVVIKGELNGSEDLTIEGHVEGKIELRDHVLTIGPNGKIKAELFAKAVVVLGEVKGNVTATEKVDIRENGSVEGDITAPRVAIAEGAHFRGSVDMAAKGKQPQQSKPTEVRSQSGPQGVVVTPNPQNQQSQAGQPQGQRAVGA